MNAVTVVVIVALAFVGWLLLAVLWLAYRGLVVEYKRLAAKCDGLLRADDPASDAQARYEATLPELQDDDLEDSDGTC